MIVENANRSHAEDVCNVDGFFPTMRVNLAVFATAGLSIPKSAISAVHYRSSMIGLAFLVASSQARMSLEYYQGIFFIRDGWAVFAAPTSGKPEPPDFIRFRRGDTYTVWDKRGLAVRSSHWIYETRFQELAVSPKLFSATQIHKNLARIKNGEITPEATSMAGALRLGTDAFFLPRWIDKKGYTWLEALVRLDLSAKHPKPVLLGRFPGTSLADGTIDHRLFALGQQPAVIVRKEGEWGVSTYDHLQGEFNYTHIGERLRAYAQLETNNVSYIEAEDGGLMRVGVAELSTGSRNDVLEDRGTIRTLDALRPLCALVISPERTTIRNLQTGSAMDLPPDSTAMRTASGVLVWWPKAQPKHALLLDPARWEGLADWQGPPPPKTEVEVKPQTDVKAESKEKPVPTPPHSKKSGVKKAS